MTILKTLIESDSLPKKSSYLIAHGQKNIELAFTFLVINQHGEYTVEYTIELVNNQKDGDLMVTQEKIRYKENQYRKQFKNLIVKDEEEITVRKKSLTTMNPDHKLKLMLANEMATMNRTSFIFRNELAEVLSELLDEEEFELIKNIKINFNQNFHIIDNFQNGLILANIIMPFSFQLEHARGKIPYELKEPMVLPENAFEAIKNVIAQINAVIGSIIPGLQVIVNPINRETLEDSSQGVRFEFLSEKDGVVLPLRCESDGTLKLISILSTLIAVYNNPNACVVIDELDSGIFEYLLGEILEVIEQSGQGQLFFTSHNLRILEVLDHKSIWFTTMNEFNRYIQMKGVKQTNNLRDVYIRAVQLGGQAESLYKETDQYDIKKSFRITKEVKG